MKRTYEYGTILFSISRCTHTCIVKVKGKIKQSIIITDWLE